MINPMTGQNRKELGHQHSQSNNKLIDYGIVLVDDTVRGVSMKEKENNVIELGSGNQTQGELVVCTPPESVDEQIAVLKAQVQLLSLVISKVTKNIQAKQQFIKNTAIRRT